VLDALAVRRRRLRWPEAVFEEPRRDGRGAPLGHSRCTAGADLFEHQQRVLVDRDALVVDATVEIRVVLEDHGAAPMREEVRQAIGSKLSNNFGNSIPDFWKGVRPAADGRRGCYHMERNCAFPRRAMGPFLSAVLVAGS